MEIHNLTLEDWKRIKPELPDSFLDYSVKKHSEPIGYSKFKGDPHPIFGNMNKVFDKNCTYPVYDDGEHTFVIGKDGKAYKLTPPVAWTKIKPI